MAEQRQVSFLNNSCKTELAKYNMYWLLLCTVMLVTVR